jgi:hypothetical protein
MDDGTDGLEDIALEQAKKSSAMLLIFLSKARRPGKYGDRPVEVEESLPLRLGRYQPRRS